MSTFSGEDQVPGPTMPGQKRYLNLQVADPKVQSIHFEVMYGMTKDVCGVATINSHTLMALAQRVTQEVVLGDHTILTGAFMDPAIPLGSSYLDPDFCENNSTAIDCLRSNSLPNEGAQFIRSFSGYLPSFITAVEMKYGSTSMQQLLFPNTNGLQIKIRLKK